MSSKEMKESAALYGIAMIFSVALIIANNSGIMPATACYKFIRMFADGVASGVIILGIVILPSLGIVALVHRVRIRLCDKSPCDRDG